MFSKILKICTEEYLTSVKSYHRLDKEVDIYKNPNSSEFREFIKSGVKSGDFRDLTHYFIRFIIDTNTGTLYIWNGSLALHRDIMKLLKLGVRGIVSGSLDSEQKIINYDPHNNGFKDPDKIIAQTKKYLSPLVKLESIRYPSGAIVKGYTYYINGEYIKDTETIEEAVVRETKPLMNPSLPEIRKLLVNSVKNSKIYSNWRNDGQEDIRFVFTPNNWYVADANEWIHGDIIKEFNISYSSNYVCGGITYDGYLWFYKYMLLDFLNYPVGNRAFKPSEEIIDLFKSTHFYKLIKPIVTDIEFE